MLLRFILAASTLLVSHVTLGEDATKDVASKPLKFVQINCNPRDAKTLISTLTLAQQLRERGNDVVVFADLEAAVIGERTLRHVPNDRRDEIRQLLDQLTAAGVKLLVCPHCAKQFDLGPTSLRRGASMTNRAQLDELKERADQIFEYREPPVKQPNEEAPQVQRKSFNLLKGAI